LPEADAELLLAPRLRLPAAAAAEEEEEEEEEERGKRGLAGGVVAADLEEEAAEEGEERVLLSSISIAAASAASALLRVLPAGASEEEGGDVAGGVVATEEAVEGAGGEAGALWVGGGVVAAGLASPAEEAAAVVVVVGLEAAAVVMVSSGMCRSIWFRRAARLLSVPVLASRAAVALCIRGRWRRLRIPEGESVSDMPTINQAGTHARTLDVGPRGDPLEAEDALESLDRLLSVLWHVGNAGEELLGGVLGHRPLSPVRALVVPVELVQ
jgi:hypothetical protein